MEYFMVFTYFLVMWIQDTMSENPISLWANTTIVSPGEAYSVTCQSIYTDIWLSKNTDYIVGEGCQFYTDVSIQKYRCSWVKYKTGHIIKLTVLHGEDNATTVQWGCGYFSLSQGSVSNGLKITVLYPVRSSTIDRIMTTYTAEPISPSSPNSTEEFSIQAAESSDYRNLNICFGILATLVGVILVITYIHRR